MAQIKKKHLFSLDPKAWEGVPNSVMVNVGHNRQIRRIWSAFDQAYVLECFLHGHNIVTFVPDRSGQWFTVRLETCGYPTVTTRQAMQDFCRAFGVSQFGASFAKGGFTVGYHERGLGRVEVSAGGGDCIAFHVHESDLSEAAI